MTKVFVDEKLRTFPEVSIQPLDKDFAGRKVRMLARRTQGNQIMDDVQWAVLTKLVVLNPERSLIASGNSIARASLVARGNVLSRGY